MRAIAACIALMACTTQTQSVRPALMGVCEAIGVPIVSGIELPTLEGSSEAVPTGGIYLDAYADHWVINGHTFKTLSDAEAPLLAARTAHKKRVEDPVLIVSAPASMPAARVGASMRMAYIVGFRKIRVLAFSTDAIRMPPPMDATYDADLRARTQDLPPSERARVVAEELGETLTGCQPAQQAMGRVAVAPSGRKCVVLAETLSAALPQCPSLDAPKVASLARFMATPAYPNKPSALALTLDRDAAAVSMDGTWQDFVTARAAAAPGAFWPQRKN